MGKQSSIFLAISILATIAAGTGFFLLHQQQQETQQAERMMRADAAATDNAKIAALDQELKHAAARAIPTPEEPSIPPDQAAPSPLEQEKQRDALQIGIVGKRLQNQYATNWELSSARATNVLRYLQEALKIPGSQLFAVGYGSHHPVADNSTEEGRRLNRRIEIVLTPQLERSRKEE